MLTVISGIVVTTFGFATKTLTPAEGLFHLDERIALQLAPLSSSAKADDPVFRADHVQRWRHGVLDTRFRGYDGRS
jgi:hypothetical protein